MAKHTTIPTPPKADPPKPAEAVAPASPAEPAGPAEAVAPASPAEPAGPASATNPDLMRNDADPKVVPLFGRGRDGGAYPQG
jgi:hypothetical protein